MSLAQQKLSCHGAGETWEMGTGPATDSNGDSGITLARSTPTGDMSGLKAEGPRQADRWGRPSLTGSHAGSHRGERLSEIPDSPEQRAETSPRSRTDLNGSGCPHMELRI